MAIYYINVQIIGRSAGRTATGAAAYRAGQRIEDERTGQVFDYTRRRGEIETEILAPDNAPAWVQERERLWNQVEKAERRTDAQVAREIAVAFPKELDANQQRELIRGYVREQFVSQGMVADVAIHRNLDNPHAHIMLTMREIGPEGFSAKKNREWNKPEQLERWRSEWASHANRALDRAGREERIDHRSLAEQGLDRAPQVHLGPHASALERRGVLTDKGDHNRLVAEHNAVVIDLEQAKEERLRLQHEKTAADRSAARVQSGWAHDHAKVLARLEAANGGQELTHGDLAYRHDALVRNLNAVEVNIAEIAADGTRLRHAERALREQRAAQAELRKHDGPMRTVKRWFSQEARETYTKAQQRVVEAGNTVNLYGIRSEAELAQRKAEWEQRQGVLPHLHQKAESLRASIQPLEKAMEGFSRAAERQRQAAERERRAHEERLVRQWERERGQSRDRDSGRGR